MGSMWLERPSVHAVATLQQGIQDIAWLNNLRVMFSRIRDKCGRCKREMRGRVNPLPTTGNCDQKVYHIKKTYFSPEIQSEEDTETEDESTLISKNYANIPSHLKKLKVMKGCRNRTLQKARAPKQSTYSIPVPRQEFLSLKSTTDFDDYFNGPTIQDMISYHNNLDLSSGNEYSQSVKGWESFKDYGYRLLPDFAIMFNRQDPILVKEHFLPTPLRENTTNRSESPSEFQSSSSSSSSYTSPSSFSSRSTVQKLNSVSDIAIPPENPLVKSMDGIDDAEVLGLDEMLHITRDHRGEESADMFVCGKMPQDDRRYIYLSPERDAVDLSCDEVDVTLDIDSIIWVTYHLRVLTSVRIDVLPYFNRAPPIERDNHCRVEILWPPSDVDRKRGENRREWFTKSVPLSRIPHIPFAHMGDGTGSFNFYVAFPRMMHKNTFTGYWATLIPAEVQSLWFTEVLIPAIISAAAPGTNAYTDFTWDEWKWKATVNNRLQTSKSITLDPHSLILLQDKMRDIIKCRPDVLDMFGSFFYIMDSRGIKLSTMNVRGRDYDPYVTLKKEVPGLLWEDMMLRENGQLVMDLGISFHPVPISGEALTGVWNLERVLNSHTISGANSPEIFPLCTMPNYGGVESVMEAPRSRAVQLLNRLSYNLLFEAFRRPGQDEKFCADVEAYEMSPTFHRTCKDFIRIYDGAKEKCYGVREEIRGSGLAIVEAIKYAEIKVHIRLILYSDEISSLSFQISGQKLFTGWNDSLDTFRDTL